jgi:hypothetical protein
LGEGTREREERGAHVPTFREREGMREREATNRRRSGPDADAPAEDAAEDD